ncbi:hypothetical protein JCM6882_006003 [Rhodosporidiobolus microsporus]
MSNTNAPIGVVVLARHGDRTGFYQDPKTYTASDTVLTPLGEQQNFRLGQILNNIYAADNSSRKIEGLSSIEMVGSQINATADAGGEGSVIDDSATALWQGFYPPRANISSMTLANGSTINSPLGGYQYVKVETVLPADDVDFEPWTNCKTWVSRNAEVYNSTEFVARAQQEEPFLSMLRSSGLVGNRTVSLANVYNVFDFINVNSLHNSSYAADLNATGDGTLAHVRDLASYHEYALFTAPGKGDLGNIAGRALLSRIFESLRSFTAEENDVKVAHYHMAYKPFLSLFNMTNIAAASNPSFPEPYAMVDYASLGVFEIRPGGSGSSGYDVRFGFRNGTELGDDVTYYSLFGSDSHDVDLDTFASELEPYVIPNNTAWCNLCENDGSVPACSEVYLAQQYEDLADKYQKIADGHFTSVGSGFIGACVTIVVMLAALGALYGLGWVQFGKKNKQTKGDRYPLNEQGSFKGSLSTTA